MVCAYSERSNFFSNLNYYRQTGKLEKKADHGAFKLKPNLGIKIYKLVSGFFFIFLNGKI